MTITAEPRSDDAAADATLDRRLPLDGELLAYAALVALGLALRLWDLGARALHHDESMHAYYAYELFRGRGYAHDPLLHGTVPYIFNALAYFLFGATDATARLVPALLGSALVAVPYTLRAWLGRAGALAAAALLALSPSFLYFSRFIREDIYAACFTLVVVAAMFAYWQTRRTGALVALAVALAFGFAAKEVMYIHAGLFASFLLALSWRDLLVLLRRGGPLSPAGDLLVVFCTLVAPLAAGAGLLLKRWLGLPLPSVAEVSSSLTTRLGLAFDPLLLGLFGALLVGAAAVGLRWDRERWPRVALAFFLTFALLFTTLLSNPAGLFTGAISGLAYWVVQHEVQRGGQPWYYYLLLILLYEHLIVAAGLLGIGWAAWRRQLGQPFVAFLIWWAAGALLLYSWAGEKMPWLVLHPTLPFALLAGRAIGDLAAGVDWPAAWRAGAWRVPLGVALLATIALGIGHLVPGQGATPLERQRALYQVALLVAVLVLVAAWLGGALRALGRSAGLRLLALSLFGLLGLFSLRTAWQVTYQHGDVAVEMLVYTQTTPDVLAVMRDIERVAFRTGAGKDLRVAYDSETSWPFEWYLREYRGRAFYGQGLPPGDAPVVLVGVDDGHDARVRPLLAGRYVGQRYRLRWWFQEEYKTLTWAEVLRTPFDEGLRTRLWRYLLYRETAPLGSTDFMFYVRRDLVGGAWLPAPTVAAQQAQEQALAAREQAVAPLAAWGGPDVLAEPKALAVGPDGDVYVAEGRSSRVTVFDRAGRVVRQWGSPGEGPGQFREPWGIAVDRQGRVFVADTWNHRIQVFDAEGRFLRQWGGLIDTAGRAAGGEGRFYGPRGLALDAQGQLYVADTGNKRIQVFDAEGRFLRQFGGAGALPGQLNEPVGMAFDSQGTLFVADTWNRRVQQLTAEGRPLQQWPVPGWESESVVNKPYLGVDATGTVYASDPENHRLLLFQRDGTLVAAWRLEGSTFNLPTGLAIDAEGRLLVADSANHRVVVLARAR
jgi:uncharacterized protein (TIGR03663 family)